MHVLRFVILASIMSFMTLGGIVTIFAVQSESRLQA